MRNSGISGERGDNLFTPRQCNTSGERCGFDTENRWVHWRTLFDGPIEISSSHKVPKIGQGDELQLLRCNRMTAALDVSSVLKSKLSVAQEFVEGKSSDFPNSWPFSASFTVNVSGPPVTRSFDLILKVR